MKRDAHIPIDVPDAMWKTLLKLSGIRSRKWRHQKKAVSRLVNEAMRRFLVFAEEQVEELARGVEVIE